MVTKTIDVVTPLANLAETVVAATPSSPVRTPGATFSISDTVQNFGEVRARSSTTRYYLSLDAVRSADDKLLRP
jgi:hypothetical protein